MWLIFLPNYTCNMAFLVCVFVCLFVWRVFACERIISFDFASFSVLFFTCQEINPLTPGKICASFVSLEQFPGSAMDPYIWWPYSSVHKKPKLFNAGLSVTSFDYSVRYQVWTMIDLSCVCENVFMKISMCMCVVLCSKTWVLCLFLQQRGLGLEVLNWYKSPRLITNPDYFFTLPKEHLVCGWLPFTAK